ncbi:MAG: hypothetical protein JG777_2970 [Clostridia bacterium]|jgi:hypothetical protein|nr:hypothetical protein [Clostridia bacterium]
MDISQLKLKELLSRYFSIVVVLFPIINTYKSPLPGFDLGTFLLLVGLPMMVMLKQKYSINRLSKPIILYILYILFSYPLAFFSHKQFAHISSFYRLMKFVVIGITVFIVYGEEFFNIILAKKLLKFISILATLLIIAQFIIFYYSGKLLILTPYNIIRIEEYVNQDRSSMAMNFYRPTSFFLEPSHFAQYVILALYFYLFEDLHKKMNIMYAIIITFGLIISTSGIGLLVATVYWLLWLVLEGSSKVSGKKILQTIVLIVITSFMLILSNDLGVLAKTLDRIFLADNSFGPAVISRVFTYQMYSDLPAINKIFGIGYGNIPNGVYLNSIAYTLVVNGILGLLIVFDVFINAFLNVTLRLRILVVTFFILTVISGSFSIVGVTIYFMLIIKSKHNLVVPMK